jgi:hypothetical protein
LRASVRSKRCGRPSALSRGWLPKRRHALASAALSSRTSRGREADYDCGETREDHFRSAGPHGDLSLGDEARGLFDALAQPRVRRNIKIDRGTHLMHLEAMRFALWRESIGLLAGEDVAAAPS